MSIIKGGSVHPGDIAGSCVQGCIKGCCGSLVDSCFPVKTKYLGEVIGYCVKRPAIFHESSRRCCFRCVFDDCYEHTLGLSRTTWSSSASEAGACGGSTNRL